MTEQTDTLVEETSSKLDEVIPPAELPDDDIGESPDSDEDSFPREYVEKLRQENAKYRVRAQQSDDLAQRLHRALVEADGRLADPSDLAFSDDHLADAAVLVAAIDELLTAKPHLAARKISGDIGQGVGSVSGEVNLLGIMRGDH